MAMAKAWQLQGANGMRACMMLATFLVTFFRLRILHHVPWF
jgi:hypothetical protein